MLNNVWVRRGLLVIGLALCAVMVSRFPLGAIGDACMQLGPWVFLTPAIALVWYGASAASMRCLLEGRVPWLALYWNRLVGEGYNALLPAAGIGGEPFKLRQLSQYVETHRAVVALINDRLIDNALAFAYSGGTVAIGALMIEMTTGVRTSMLGYGVAGLGIAAVMVTVMVTTASSRIAGKIARLLGADQLGHERVRVAVLVRAGLWCGLGKLIGMLEIALLFHLLDVQFDIADVFFTAGALSAAGFIGGAIPQGLGVAEAATVGVFQILHFPGPAGVAFALARRGRMLLVAVIGVVLHLTFGRARTQTGTGEAAASRG
ncbi:MAG: flippase-like domain-containing protein [Deltaproteobacteria bacterium]|nr:flippase-like domain-containing protein [Deltaproteobacteria bacterium]